MWALGSVITLLSHSAAFCFCKSHFQAIKDLCVDADDGFYSCSLLSLYGCSFSLSASYWMSATWGTFDLFNLMDIFVVLLCGIIVQHSHIKLGVFTLANKKHVIRWKAPEQVDLEFCCFQGQEWTVKLNLVLRIMERLNSSSWQLESKVHQLMKTGWYCRKLQNKQISGPWLFY